ncbi:golgin subfamily A member 5 isoform X2 [Plodia interpunctella]|uniref:golgin subfamily A member 5 isoform X2 n=1 Tax=Plodia interpunctella TaxID=58824 RepID=UPI0023687F66|nr:golgin subfamily A member 5 isoform X2 [Plodia interpunctella]
MDWFADLAGKAENILTSLDESTGAALRNHNPVKVKKIDGISNTEPIWKKNPSPPPRVPPKKYTAASETRSIYMPPRKPSLPFQPTHSTTKETPELKEKPFKKKLPTRRVQHYTLNHCPKTLVGDIKGSDVDDTYGLRQRRYHSSLPEDLDLINTESFTYRMQNLEVENAMLKNELNVMNREVSELLEKLRKAEDEQKDTSSRLADVQIVKHQLCAEKENLSSQLAQLKLKIQDVTITEVTKLKDQNARLEKEVKLLDDRNNELEDKIKRLTEKNHERDQSQTKVENDLRHAQATISDLENDLERSKAECLRLEKDWETYKLRVKSMLYAKDSEIKSLQEGLNLTEDTKVLIEQLESLKEEREVLSESILRVRNECDNMKQHIDQLESRHNSAERVVSALREALRDERAARNRTETQCIAMGKELKSIQIETGQTIANLRTALREKENEIIQLRESVSVPTTAPSALNVGDYDVMQETIDNDKIHYLTNTLVQKQEKIDSLLADNNMLKIQLDKLQSKYKAEVQQNKQSVVNVQDTEYRRTRPPSALSKLSLRMGVALKRYPVFSLFILVYMIGLHFWVLTVLLTSSPDGYIQRNSKS